jgi:serine/threonine-protein kinase
VKGYEVENVIGRGAMGVVYRAFDPRLSRYAAIKMLTPERVVSSEARERFMREARAAASIRHENVITIYAVDEVNGLPCLIMEFLEGASLQDHLDDAGALPIADVLHCARQIAAGLAAAHRRGVVHRDIKPANILVEKATTRVAITDFGLARVLDDTRLSLAGALIGTPQFMAPEQFEGASVDHRADLFGFGSVLYSLCAGRTPFSGDSLSALMRQVCDSRPTPLRAVRPEAPRWLEEMINRLHAKQPASRIQSADEVLQVIDQNSGRL